MLAFLRSIVAQGGAQIATVLLGLVANKIIAVMLGASGTGFFALLRQLHDLSVSWVGLGVGQGLVQGLSAREGDAKRGLLGTACWLYGLAALLVAIVFVAMPMTLASWVMDSDAISAAQAVRLVGLTAAFGLIANLLGALLQSHGAIVQYSLTQVLANVALAAAAYPVALAASSQSPYLTLLIAIPLLIQILVTLIMNRRLRLWSQLRSAYFGWNQAGLEHFTGYIGFGLAQLAIGIGSGLLARALIVHGYDLQGVGHFQAAWALSVQSVALVLTPFTTYAIPKLASVQKDRPAYEKNWHDMTLVVWAATVPLVVVGLAFKPLLLRIFYTGEFLEAVPMLQWMLLANLVKSASWLLATPFLAAARLRQHLALGLILDVSFVVGVWGATNWGLDLRYIGIAFLVSYSLYLAAAWLLCWRYFALAFSPRLLRAMAGGIILAVGVAALTWDERIVNWPLALAATIAACLLGVAVLDSQRRATLLRLLMRGGRAS